jgi:glycosyltransferase involved in cell wall biosynthesis
LRTSLEALAAKLELSHVRFLGHLSAGHLHDALAAARLNVLPSLWPEVFGQSVVEAFTLARPSAAARSGGLPEVIDASPAGDGWLFPPGDVDALAACLEEALRDPSAARQKGRRGLEKTRRVYHPQAHYQQLSRIYTGL